MKINANSILSLSAIFAACIYAASAHADMTTPSHTPPQEAVQACNGKAENDSCDFTGKQNEAITGSCHKGPDGRGVLACVPVNAQGHPAGTQQAQ